MKKCYQIQVIGLVQGVWYRASAKRKAEELGILGFVKNLADGSVFLEVEGTEQALQTLVKWCQEGPTFAQVEEVKFAEVLLRGFKQFEIKR